MVMIMELTIMYVFFKKYMWLYLDFKSTIYRFQNVIKWGISIRFSPKKKRSSLPTQILDPIQPKSVPVGVVWVVWVGRKKRKTNPTQPSLFDWFGYFFPLNPTRPDPCTPLMEATMAHRWQGGGLPMQLSVFKNIKGRTKLSIKIVISKIY